mmetsp:Transcript_18370/g.51748  ORF Transcript_18370/g.51748 Transcript_18370/m.51748 type:complete len:201 (-) Transcript_18370:1501-2103(-)
MLHTSAPPPPHVPQPQLHSSLHSSYHQFAMSARLTTIKTEDMIIFSAWNRSPLLLLGKVRVLGWTEAGIAGTANEAVVNIDCGAAHVARPSLGVLGVGRPCEADAIDFCADNDAVAVQTCAEGAMSSFTLASPISANSMDRMAGDGSRAQSAKARSRDGNGFRHLMVRPVICDSSGGEVRRETNTRADVEATKMNQPMYK